jgi:hypothetical protein
MQKLKNTKIATIFAIILMLTVTSTLVALPTANAHDPPWTVPTTAYVSCAPGTVGVGQYTVIVVWLDRYDPTATGITGGRYDGFKIDITKPNGDNETIGPFTSSSAVASDFRIYTPDQVGTYTIVFSWPGQTITNGTGAVSTGGIPYVGDFFEGSTSKPFYLTVQEEPVPNWQEPALPTDYWTRPINGANRDWSTLASNWLKGSWLVNNFQDQGTLPLTAHVLWSTPITPGYSGGIADGRWPGIPADVNDYENPWTVPIIMNGKIYYNTPSVSDSSMHGYYCVDLYTGQQIWYKNGTDNGLNNPYTMIALGTGSSGVKTSQSYASLTQGQLYHYYSANGDGILSYLIMVQGTTWYFLDASTGNWIFSLINVPSGTAITDQDGSLLRYSYNAAKGNFLCWNSSQAIRPGHPVGANQQLWRPPQGGIIDAVNDTVWTTMVSSPFDPESLSPDDILPRSGYTMNVTSDSLKGLPGSITAILQDDNHVPKQIFGSQGGEPLGMGMMGLSKTDTYPVWLVSIDEHVTGYNPPTASTNTQANNLGFGITLLMNKNIQVPVPGRNDTWSIAAVDYNSQTFHLKDPQTCQTWCYSLTTGNLLWGPTTSFNQMDYYGLSESVYYGKLIQFSQYGGWMAAYNVTNGDLLWTYNATAAAPYEAAYGSNMPLSLGAVCDGCALLYSTEHSPTKPLWRESYVRCVNLTDGTEIWKLLDFNLGLAVADGCIVSGSQYDNMIYTIGKGPSATTVSAPQLVPTLGSSVMITGTVTDQSPGATAYATKYGLTTGVPTVSDADQEAWMEYLYQQQAKPTSATGVQVSLDTIDPNGNYVHIGTVTSDLTGAYGYKWTPEIPGTYQIIATFEGSNSYGSSHAQTYVGVDDAASTPSPYPVTTLPPTEMYFAISTVAIIIAIAIATALMMLRKRP